MTSKFRKISPDIQVKLDYGFARVRDIAFDAVIELWRQRKSEGWKQSDLADKLGRDTGWLSRKLKGPGNWTLRTFGEMVEALDGDAEIKIVPLKDLQAAAKQQNFDAYARFSPRKYSPDRPIIVNMSGKTDYQPFSIKTASNTEVVYYD